MLIKPKLIEITNIDGNNLKFNIGRIPAIVGREILVGYPSSLIPKVGEYKVNEALMIKLLSFVEAYNADDEPVTLGGVNNDHIINTYVTDATTLMLLEKEMFAYNFPFLKFEKSKGFLSSFVSKIKDDSFVDSCVNKFKIAAFDIYTKMKK
jgi:hypothetical protein